MTKRPKAPPRYANQAVPWTDLIAALTPAERAERRRVAEAIQLGIIEATRPGTRLTVAEFWGPDARAAR